MNVIVGYRPTPEGRAALSRAVDETRRLGGARLLVINSAEQPTGSPEPISAEHGVDALSQRLAAAGIAHDIRQLDVNDDPAESIVPASPTQRPTSSSSVCAGARRWENSSSEASPNKFSSRRNAPSLLSRARDVSPSTEAWPRCLAGPTDPSCSGPIGPSCEVTAG